MFGGVPLSELVDLFQASMAKMAYSRQLLWQKHQTLLEEKLLKRRRRGLQCARKTGSVPTLSAINFADPVAVARSAEAFKNRQVIIIVDKY
uniref:RNA-directed DNA polymerase n=1 Tax=Ascaris lumbricoides TaxID=6252 RepID=A0A0M3HJP4_ASCLU